MNVHYNLGKANVVVDGLTRMNMGSTTNIKDEKKELVKDIRILHVDEVAYELALPAGLASSHPVFHVSMLKKCLGDPASILPGEGLEVEEDLSYEEVFVEISDKHIKRLRKKEVATVKLLWRNHLVEGATWEAKADMRSRYPHLFRS
nr:uncharacterized protein LOC109119072 [Solanum lycopersicum]